jgi:hypothetical protein
MKGVHMQKPIHLYIVFNPMLNNEGVYPSQAHEFYFQLKNKAKSGETEKAFMYWGKLNVNDCKDEKFEEYQEIINKNKLNGEDTHLFISDYHHFWVAKIESVHEEIYKKDHTLAFYDDKNVGIWFKVTDMDLLSAEFQETSFYLNQLYVENEFEEQVIDSIHPYIGGVQFPLKVQDKSMERYFGNTFAEDGPRVNRQNALIENPKMTDEIRFQVNSFVIPPQVFSKLSNIVKSEILSVETVFSKREKDNPELFKNILTSYLKILENVMSDTMGPVLREEYGRCLFISSDGKKFFEHKMDNNIPINEYKKVISMQAFVNLLSDVSSFGNLSLTGLEKDNPELVFYFVNTLCPILKKFELVEKRECLQRVDNELQISKFEAIDVRNEILGVGCKGVINSLVKLTLLKYPEKQFKSVA